MAKRDEREPERIAARVLPERQESVKGESRNAKKEPGVNQRQTQKSFAFPNAARFVPRNLKRCCASLGNASRCLDAGAEASVRPAARGGTRGKKSSDNFYFPSCNRRKTVI